MAKNDDKRARNRIDREGSIAQNNLDNLRNDMLVPAAQNSYNDWRRASDTAFADYGNIMGDYNNFAQTGGYSPADISAIRSRAASPIRSIYAGANREVDRTKSLQGGYSPGYGVLKSRMAREQSSALSDRAMETEGMLAEMKNAGKRFGVAGKSTLYGTSPGMATTFGNQSQAANSNWLQAQGLQNQLGLGMMNAQIGAGHLQGKWQQTFDNLVDVGKTAAALGSAF